jgi:hypothetical protein
MADLTVDYATLEHPEQSLQRIATELDGADAHRDADAGIWGSSDIAEAMRNFVDNWDRHRGKLVESVKNVGGMCASVREAFAAADQDLADTMAHAGQG